MMDPSAHTDSVEHALHGSQPAAPAKKPISMHEDVPVWHDCCCCEAEPRWVAVADELGIDLDAGWTTGTE